MTGAPRSVSSVYGLSNGGVQAPKGGYLGAERIPFFFKPQVGSHPTMASIVPPAYRWNGLFGEKALDVHTFIHVSLHPSCLILALSGAQHMSAGNSGFCLKKKVIMRCFVSIPS